MKLITKGEQTGDYCLLKNLICGFFIAFLYSSHSAAKLNTTIFENLQSIVKCETALESPAPPIDIDEELLAKLFENGLYEPRPLQRLFKNNYKKEGWVSSVVNWAHHKLLNRSEVLKQMGPVNKKIAIVGAGVHSVVTVANLLKQRPELKEHIVYIEAGNTVTGPFHQRVRFKPHVRNGIFNLGKKDPGLFTGCTFSIRHLVGREKNPWAEVIGQTALLNLMALDVDVIFDAPVSKIQSRNSLLQNLTSHPEKYMIPLAHGQKVYADHIVMAVGINELDFNHFDPSSKSYLNKELGASYKADSNFEESPPRIEDYLHFLERMAYDNISGRGLKAYQGKNVIVAGGGPGGANAIRLILKAKGVKITWLGQSARSGKEYLQQFDKDDVKNKHKKRGIPAAIDEGRIQTCGYYAWRVEELEKGEVLVTCRPSGDGMEQQVKGDHLLLAVGANSSVPQILDGFNGLETSGLKINDYTNLVGYPVNKSWKYVGRQVISEKGSEEIYIIGAAANLPFVRKGDMLDHSNSIHVLAPLSAAFGKYLSARVPADENF